jgi:hypothetical protein
MNTDQIWSVLAQFALHEHDELFVRSKRSVSDDAELAEVSWQARLSNVFDRLRIHKPARIL